MQSFNTKSSTARLGLLQPYYDFEKILIVIVVLYSFHKTAFWVYVPNQRVECHTI